MDNIYKQSKGPRGRYLYFKNGKMISKKDIPEDILQTMEPGKPVSDASPEFQKCIFCGSLSTDPKYINGQKVNLCLDDYHGKTTGECVEQLRSIDSQLVTSNT